MRTLLVIIGLLFSVPASAAEKYYMSLGAYMALEEAATDKAIGSPVVNVYLGGVLEALGMANALLESEKRKELYCLGKSSISAEILRRFINEYAASIRNLGDKAVQTSYSELNVGSVATFVLRNKFPCPK